MTTKEWAIWAVVVIAIIIAGAAIFYSFGRDYSDDYIGGAPTSTTSSPYVGGTLCAGDTRLCPDGSSVGRVSPGCDFAVCPNSDKNSVKVIVPAPGPSGY